MFLQPGALDQHTMILQRNLLKAFKKKYTFHPEAYRILEKYYGKKNFNDGRKKKWQ